MQLFISDQTVRSVCSTKYPVAEFSRRSGSLSQYYVSPSSWYEGKLYLNFGFITLKETKTAQMHNPLRIYLHEQENAVFVVDD